MEISQILTLVGAAVKVVMEVAPDIIKAAQDAKPLATEFFKAFGGREPTAEEEEAIWTIVQDLSRQLQEPLPPE